jgi:hypothetical protein
MDALYMDKWSRMKIKVQNILQKTSSGILIVKAHLLACDLVKDNHGERLGTDLEEVLTQHLVTGEPILKCLCP